MTDETKSEGATDVGIVVALGEELRELLDLARPYTPEHAGDLDAYSFERGGYRCLATLMGDMGEQHATRVTERLIERRSPGSVVVMGIAGGIHKDLKVGDVYVPPQATEYMEGIKASPTLFGGFEFKPAGEAYRADHKLLAAVRRFEFTHEEGYKRWREQARADLDALIADSTTRDSLFTKNLVRREVQLLADGHLATGPIVGAAEAFSAWIQGFDRNAKALEMESAAVLLSAQSRSSITRALAIRGISDYGDERKKELDAIGEGSLRKYAMRNAVRLLFAMLDVGAWPREREAPNPR